MNRQMNRSFGVVRALILITSTATASELQDYVLQCQDESGFYAHEVPQLDCNNGEQFKLGARNPINDFAFHHRVNDNVDLVAAYGLACNDKGQPEFDSDCVCLRNTGTGTYLNVSSQDETAAVGTYEIRDCDSRRWIVEPVPGPGSSDFRLRNVWSRKYLTLRDAGDYSGIDSRSLNTGWAG